MAKQTLLLAEADNKARRVLKVSLEQAGYAVTAAKDGAEALSALGKEAPEIVVAATNLPLLDGHALVRRMKERSDWARIPIVLMTDGDAIEDKIRGLELGVEEQLSKPVFVKELLARVHMLIAKRVREQLSDGSEAQIVRASFAEIAPVDVLESLEHGTRSGVMRVRRGIYSGEIFFRRGDIVDARLKKLRGEEAVYRILGWTDGEVEVEFGPVDLEDIVERKARALLEAGMRHAAEYNRLTEVLPPLAAVLSVDRPALTERAGEIPGELRGLLSLFDGKRTLAEVIDESPFDDLSTLATVEKLHREGLLGTGATGNRAEEPPSAEAPATPETRRTKRGPSEPPSWVEPIEKTAMQVPAAPAIPSFDAIEVAPPPKSEPPPEPPKSEPPPTPRAGGANETREAGTADTQRAPIEALRADDKPPSSRPPVAPTSSPPPPITSSSKPPVKELSSSGVSEDFFASMPPSEPPESVPPSSEEVAAYLTEEQLERKRKGKRLVIGVVAGLALVTGLLLLVGRGSSSLPSASASAGSGPSAPSQASAPASASAPAPLVSVAPPEPSASAEPDTPASAEPALPEVADPLAETQKLLNQGKWEEAALMAQAAIKKDPENGDGYLYLGSAYQMLRRYDEEKAAYNACVKHGKKGQVAFCRSMGGKADAP